MIFNHLLTNVPIITTSQESLIIGISSYVAGYILLNMLENTRQKNNLPSTLPLPRNVFDNMKEVPWITPVTIDPFRSTPNLDDLYNNSYMIGTRQRKVAQYITAKKCKTITGIQEAHPDWSDFYNYTIYIYKKLIF